MNLTIMKSVTAAAVATAALAIPTTAFAAGVFDDVPDDKFYAEPVDWAVANDITTGKSPTSFAPLDNVTRGETVTFLKRYHDNIAEPANEALQQGTDATSAVVAMLNARMATLEGLDTATRIDSLEDDAKAFAVSSPAVVSVYDMTFTPQIVASVEVTAPVDGTVTTNSAALSPTNSGGNGARCSLNDSAAYDFAYEQAFDTRGTGFLNGTLSGTRMFEISAGETATYNLVCATAFDDGTTITVSDIVVTALFTPEA